MCQPRRALCSDPDRGMPTAFTASCFENWMRTLQEQGDERSLTDVRLLAQDKKYRAEFKLRHENWRYAMEAIESFGSSRTADRREGAAYKLAKKQLPKAAVGWSDELRQYALELMSRAGVRDAVSVAADEVRKLESSYGKLTEGQQCDGGAPDERASAIGDRLVVARTLHRSLPPAPQAMEQGTAATQSVAYVTCLVASIMFAILFVLRWSCQRHVRILQRKHGGARTYGCRGTFEQLGRVGVQWWESAAQYAGQWRQEQPAVVVTAPAQRQAQRKRKPPKGPAKAARKQPEAVPKASADKQATQGSESPPHKAKKKVGKKAPNQKVEKKPEAKKQEKKTKEKKTKEKQSAAKKNKNKKKAAAAAASEQRVVEVVEAPGSEKSGKQKPEKKNAPPEPSSVAASPTRPKIVVRPTEPGPVTVFRKRQSSQPVSDVSEPDLEDDEQTQRGHESPRKSGKVQGLPDKAAGGKLSWAQKLQAGGRSKADAVSPPSPAKQGVVQAQGETAEDAPTAAPTLAPAPQGKARRRQRTLSQTAEDEGSDDGGGVFPTKRQPKEDSKASNPWQEKKLERERAQARASKHGAWAGRPEEAAGAIGNSSVPEREPNKAKQSKAAPNADLKATQAKTEAAEKAKQLVAPLPSFLKPETEKAPREEQRPEAAQSASASASAVALSLQSLDRDASPLSTPTSAPSSPASSRSSAKADHQPDASSANAERQVRQSTGTRNAHESEAARRPRTGQDGQREMPVGVPMPMMPMPMQMGMPMQGQMAMPMHPGAHQHGQMPAQAMWQGQPMHPQAAAQMHHFNAMQQQLFEQRLRCRQALEQQVCTAALHPHPKQHPTPTKTASSRRFCSTSRPTTSAAISSCGLTWMLMDSSSFVRFPVTFWHRMRKGR